MRGPPDDRPNAGRRDESEAEFADELLAAIPRDVRQAFAGRIVAALHDASSIWPNVRFPPAAMMFRRLAERVANEPDPLAALDGLHLRDLCLASACAAGEPRAIERFERELMVRVGEFVRKIDRTPQFADELRQELREKLFVARNGLNPKIAEYAGIGELEGWLRVVAVRSAHNAIRARKPNRNVADDELPLKAAGPDPELAVARQTDRVAFRTAFADAMGNLTSQQRRLLRLHYLDGLSSRSIADIEGVSGPTVRRWIDGARRTLLETTRGLLASRFRLAPDAVEIGWADLESGLDLSLSRLLRSEILTP